jgi:hypothetical protein
MDDQQDPVKVKFFNNLKKWLIKGDISELKQSDIGNLSNIIKQHEHLTKYKIIKWSADLQLSEEQMQDLLFYIEDGGKNKLRYLSSNLMLLILPFF